VGLRRFRQRLIRAAPMLAACHCPGQDRPLARSRSGGALCQRIAWPLKLTELPDTGGTVPAPQPQSRTVLLDERGKQLSSEDFAALLGKLARRRRARGAVPDRRRRRAWRSRARASADLLLAFGAMTWPHLLARAMLAEQLWRATSILAGHPYHRSGPAPNRSRPRPPAPPPRPIAPPAKRRRSQRESSRPRRKWASRMHGPG
jgi:23S rRNA (pseudouridine1915-N3)-methyltransferase